MRYLLLISLVFIFFGCVEKHNVGYFDESKTEQKALINTSKQEFGINGNRYLVSATYLNPIKDLNITKDKETFVVNIYSNSKSKINITKAGLNDDNSSVKWESLDINSPFAKQSPTYNKWSKYYMIYAPSQNKSKLNLLIEIDNSKRVDLKFLKDILD